MMMMMMMMMLFIHQGLFTSIRHTGTDVRKCLSNFVHSKGWNMITHPCSDFNVCFGEPLLMSGHEWINSSQSNMWMLSKGSRQVMEEFVVIMQESVCEQEVLGIGRTVRNYPISLWLQNPTDGLNHDYSMIFFNFNSWMLLFSTFKANIVLDSQCPSSRDVVLVTRYATPLLSACLNRVKAFYYNKTHLQ